MREYPRAAGMQDADRRTAMGRDACLVAEDLEDERRTPVLPLKASIRIGDSRYNG